MDQSDLTYRELAHRTGYAISVLSEAASGRRAPSWEVVKAYVEACRGDPSDWRQAWSGAVEEVRNSQTRNLDSPAQSATVGSYAHAGALINLQPPPPVQTNQQSPRRTSRGTISATSALRIFLVDDHEIVRKGVTYLFEDEPGLEVVGEAATVAEAIACIPGLSVDVAVLDVRMPDGNGVELCRDLRSQLPNLRCLILTSYSNDEALLNAIMAGASGFVLKQVLGNDLITRGAQSRRRRIPHGREDHQRADEAHPPS